MAAEKPAVDSVAPILLNGNEFLVEERSPSKRVDPGKICIPSGGIEDSETTAEALVREMQEELRVTPSRFHFVATLLYPYESVDFRVHYFVVWDWDGALQADAAETVFWTPLNTADDILEIWPDRLAIHALQEANLHTTTT